MKIHGGTQVQTSATLLGIVVLASLMTPTVKAQEASQNSEPTKAPAVHANAPERTYRLVYTLTESDGAKRIGVQHFTLTVSSAADGATSELNVGSKVPVLSGPKDSANPQTTYVDVGLTIRAQPRQTEDGLRLSSEVQQTSVSEASLEKVNQPVIRQAKVRDTALLIPGKAVMLSSFDVPGSTRHYDVEVVLEPVR